MKTAKLAAITLFISAGMLGDVEAQSLSFDTSQLPTISRQEAPRTGTFWVQRPDGRLTPLPCLPGDLPDAPIYVLPNGQFLVDASNTAVQAGAMSTHQASLAGTPENDSLPDPPAEVRNAVKFMDQQFSLLDTNDVAQTDTNLYDALLSFPADTNTAPVLQIMSYGACAVIIKASHFDFSAETRNFALLICDSVDKPLWKTVDLAGSSDSQDGWLIQGLVPA